MGKYECTQSMLRSFEWTIICV